jgi:hypothetical protein
MSYFTPFILFVLGVVLGVVIWRLQLGAKRRFELAEQALMAFQRASDGLSRMRDPFISTGELAAAKVPKDDDESEEAVYWRRRVGEREKERVRLFNMYVARADAAAPAFGDLRAAQILVDIHFGRAAADAVHVLFRARDQVYQAVNGLHGAARFDPDHERATPQQIQQHRDREVALSRNIAEHRDTKTGKPDATDTLSQQIDEAKATLESICRPVMEEPPWLRKLSDTLRRWRLM